MKTERDDPSVWTEVYERGKQMATEFVIEPSRPRTTGRQKHWENVRAATPESYWQRATCFPLVDHLLLEMQDRLLSQKNPFLGRYLVPKKLHASIHKEGSG